MISHPLHTYKRVFYNVIIVYLDFAGGMQDFNYVWYGCMEVTLELSCCKYPSTSELPKLWEENRLVSVSLYYVRAAASIFDRLYSFTFFFYPKFQSLVKFLAEAHRGVHGFVMDEHGNPIEKASLKVKGRDVGFQTTKYGEFWRILLPGVYKLEVSMYSAALKEQ